MNRDFSVIDANIARAKEGIRVIEDFCRFILRSPIFFGELKNIRHKLDAMEAKLAPAHLIGARQGNDVGFDQTNEAEYTRQ